MQFGGAGGMNPSMGGMGMTGMGGMNPSMGGMNPVMGGMGMTGMGGMNPMMGNPMMGGMNPMMGNPMMGGMNPMMGNPMMGMNPMMGNPMMGMNPMMSGMNPMMQFGGMNPGMVSPQPQTQADSNVSIDDQSGWNLIFENQNDKKSLTIRISEQKLVKEAISMYMLKSGRTDKCKFIFNNKELFGEMKICQSGLNNLSRILVISTQNVIGAN